MVNEKAPLHTSQCTTWQPNEKERDDRKKHDEKMIAIGWWMRMTWRIANTEYPLHVLVMRIDWYWLLVTLNHWSFCGRFSMIYFEMNLFLLRLCTLCIRFPSISGGDECSEWMRVVTKKLSWNVCPNFEWAGRDETSIWVFSHFFHSQTRQSKSIWSIWCCWVI